MSQWYDLLGAEVRFVRTPSFERTRIIEAGHDKPDFLFLMHGLGGHLEAYSKNVMALAKHFHVVAFDFIGHGLSAKPTDIEYSSDTYVQQLKELMDLFGADKADISGESLGGWVAGRFAVKYPERVKRLVLNTTGGIPIVSAQGREDAENLARLSQNTVAAAPTQESVRKRMQWLMHESNWGLLDDELVDTRLKFYRDKEFQAVAPKVLALLKRLADDVNGSQMIELEKIRAPSLLYWTRFNPIHDLQAAQAALPRLPNGQLYVSTHDAAHWPQYEAAEEFNSVVARYLTTGEVA